MYQAVYYWMYNYLSKIQSDKTPAFNAFLLIVLLEGSNVIGIGRCIYNTTHFKSNEQVTLKIAAIAVFALMSFNYFYLYQRRNTIFKEISGYSKSKFNLSNNIFWIYVIGSLSFFIAVVINS